MKAIAIVRTKPVMLAPTIPAITPLLSRGLELGASVVLPGVVVALVEFFGARSVPRALESNPLSGS